MLAECNPARVIITSNSLVTDTVGGERWLRVLLKVILLLHVVMPGNLFCFAQIE